MDLASLILLLLKLSVALSVLAIGFKATFSESVYLFRRPMLLLRAMLAMNVVMPLFALLVCVSFDLNPSLKITLVALSVSPIPPILPNKALKAGGCENYTIGLLVATAALSIIAIPAGLGLMEAITGVPFRISALTVAVVVLTSVLLPLLIGIAIRTVAPKFADRAAKPVGIVGMVMLLACFIPILLTSVRAVLTIIGDGTLLALASFAVVGLVAGHLLGGPQPENRSVLALATATRHPAVALTIAQANYPQQKLAGAMVLVYLVISALFAAPYLTWSKRRHPDEVAAEKHVPA